MYDYHTHSSFSDDCHIPMEEMILAAIRRGIKELAITDHYDPGYKDPDFPFILDFVNYHKALLRMEEKYQNKIKIIKGLEAGIMEGQFDVAAQAVHAFPYDFVVGSFHCLHDTELYGYDFSKADIPSLLEEFYLYVDQCLKAYKDYDVAGHLSVIDRYIHMEYPYGPYMDIIEDILKTIIADGKGLEINTSNFKYGTGIWLPRKEILRLYKELGGEILTFGSDSHEPERFLDHFKEAEELARGIGFRYFCTYENRKAKFLPL